jgi:hypothetical protein
MSMHEFENLVEASVNVLAVSGRPQRELRDIYWNLYEFEGHWDTGFTHLRNIDQLVAARFVYRYPISGHPDYAERRGYFDGIDRFDFPHTDGEYDGGFIDPPHLYVEAGSKLWQRLVDLGDLTGPDAIAPRVMPLQEIALDVAQLAERDGDVELIGCWYRLLAAELPLYEMTPEHLRSDENIAALRELVRGTGAMPVSLGRNALSDPDEQTMAEYPGLGWWYRLDA